MSVQQRRPRDPERTRAEMVEAALATLKAEGFAGTTARAIATRGGFNQALIFYHFGGVDGLLLAALDASAEERLYREDVEGGHVTVIAELIAASLAHPALGPQLVDRMRPWLAFTQEAFA